jgi:hypothetical protein
MILNETLDYQTESVKKRDMIFLFYNIRKNTKRKVIFSILS